MPTVHLSASDPSVKAIVSATFSGFTGKRVEAIITDTVSFHGTMWDEGSKRSYVLLRLADRVAQPIATAPYFQQSELHTATHTIPPGFVVVCLSTFRGVDSLEIHGPSANLSPMLPAPMELTDDERIVLAATAGLKSSYAGESNYRLSEARRETGITSDRYNAAKSALIARKLLNKAGAITVEGRNAIGSTRLFDLRNKSDLIGRADLNGPIPIGWDSV
jgi:hypothetical protein